MSVRELSVLIDFGLMGFGLIDDDNSEWVRGIPGPAGPATARRSPSPGFG